MNTNETSRILDAVAADFIPADVNLLPQITARFERKTFIQTLRARPALLIMLVLLTLGLLTGVAYAVGRSLGYIPGVGLVEQEGGVRVLSEPVSAGKNGITITVKQVVADKVRTFITYKVVGITMVNSGSPICTEPPVLQLPDGRKLTFLGGGGGGIESVTFETSYSFPPIPSGVKTVTFLSPCNQPALALHLVPASAGFATPAVEIGATYQAWGPIFAATASPTPEVTPEYSVNSPATPTPVSHGSGLYLEKVIELENAYLLIGNFTNAGGLPGVLMTSSGSDTMYPLLITDADGNLIPAKARSDINPSVAWGGIFYWAYEISKPVNAPLTLRLPGIDVETVKSASFQFDTGANPQTGQTWKIKQSVNFLGITYIVEEVAMTETGYTFSITHPAVDSPNNFSLQIVAGDDNKVWANKWYSYPTREIAAINYDNGLIPSGSLTVELTAYRTVPVPGPWILTWSPPFSK